MFTFLIAKGKVSKAKPRSKGGKRAGKAKAIKKRAPKAAAAGGAAAAAP